MNGISLRIDIVKSYILPLVVGCTVAGITVYSITLSPEFFPVIIASSMVFIASAFLMQKTVGAFTLSRLTIPGFWYLTYIVMIFIPSIFVFFEKSHPAKHSYLFAVETVLITVPVGILFVNILLKFKRHEIRRYFEKPVEDQINSAGLVVFLILLTLGMGIVIMYISEVKTIPLFHLLQHPGEYLLVAELRGESFKFLESHFTYLYFLLRVLIFPFLIVIALGYYIFTRKIKWLTLFLITTIVGTLYAAFSVAKLPVAAIFLIIFLFLYLYNGGRIEQKFYMPFLILIFAFPVLVGLLVHYGMEGISIVDIIKAIILRLFYLPALSLYYYFEFFPYVHEYLYGRSIGKLSLLMGVEYFNTANEIGRYAFPQYLETINMNAAFIGDLNADFGMFGVLSGGILAGMLLQSMQVYLLRRKKNILNLAVYSFLVFAFWLLHSTSLPVVLASNGVILVLVLPFVIKSSASFLENAVRGINHDRIK